MDVRLCGDDKKLSDSRQILLVKPKGLVGGMHAGCTGFTMILRHGLSSRRVELPFMELTRAVGLGVFCVAGSAALHQGLHLCQGLLVARAGQKRRELTFVERLTFTCPSA